MKLIQIKIIKKKKKCLHTLYTYNIDIFIYHKYNIFRDKGQKNKIIHIKLNFLLYKIIKSDGYLVYY